ncbi:hypothetical protein VNO78_34407 [Psophocarpus tetragonolobus]|uniref:Retrovirus-related Pol polyprotein from transposon TNT 1-94 n=1 Tax=Psophocarpus tetragonolobus TaxID=3891 RepID=A0AAN9NZ26_PSOTE
MAERKNQTILDMVRSILKSKKMPEEFWAEAVQCAIYVQNRIFNRYTNNISTNPETTDDEDELQQPQMRSLQDLYDSIDEVSIVCLLADSENISFEEAVQDKMWQIAMDEEMRAIDRNNTWELAELLKGSQPIV